MSNFLSIAAVTETLRQTLYTAAQEAVPESDVNVIPGRPREETGEKAAIYLFLYQVLPNSALRNNDLPTRRGDGSLASRPQVALTLTYLLSFYGKEQDYVPQRLLGRVVSTLHAQPILQREAIRNAIQNPINNNDFLKNADLADQADLVHFSPVSMNLEELSRLWSVFFQTPYALSMAYSASVVLIEEPLSTIQVLPVRKPLLYVTSITEPLVESVRSAESSSQPIHSGSTISILGQRLRGEVTRVQIDDTPYDPSPSAITPTRIDLALPASLPAGIHSLRVIQPSLMGEPPIEHISAVSNQAAFPLQPTVTAISTPAPGLVLVTLDPPVSRDQRVTLLLSQRGPTPGKQLQTYRLPAPVKNGITDDHQTTTPTIQFDSTTVPAGVYLVTVQVGGVDSGLCADSEGVYCEPSAEVK
jgi:hypothetical protein